MTSVAASLTVGLDDLVIAVSDAVAASKIHRRARQVQVIHHGINRDRVTAIAASRQSLKRELELLEAPQVVCVANYRPEKGHVRLLAAARLVHDKFPSAQFITIGQGPLREAVAHEVLQTEMASYFTVRGPEPAAVRWTACADVFVLASYREGRPVALMEAQVCGVPSVSTTVGGVPDMITDGESGLLVEAGDERGLADALLRLLNDPEERAKMGKAALSRSLGFDIRETACAIEGLYRSLTAGWPRAQS